MWTLWRTRRRRSFGEGVCGGVSAVLAPAGCISICSILPQLGLRRMPQKRSRSRNVLVCHYAELRAGRWLDRRDIDANITLESICMAATSRPSHEYGTE